MASSAFVQRAGRVPVVAESSSLTAIGRLDCGGVIVNDLSDYRIDAIPFCGVRGSGLGREGVRSAIKAMTEPKVACLSL